MTSTLVLLPGLGADSRLFSKQLGVVPNLVVPPWPTPRASDTLPTFAAKMADAIPKSDCLYLGGASLGGMVALELAALVKPKAVILIGSCTTPKAIALLVRRAGWLAPALPAFCCRPRRWWTPVLLPDLAELPREERELFWSMASGVPASFLQWGIKAILSWQPTPVSVPIRHIHGSEDRLIPVRSVSPDEVVVGGGHLLTMTHAEAVNAFVVSTVSNGSML